MHASAVRCAQVRALAGFVAERPHSHPPVATGDFNVDGVWPSDHAAVLAVIGN